jgi:L-seryl-tRNA(Ser) seleniumtransferase
MADFRVIPSIERLRQREAVRALEAKYGHAALVDALRAEADALRERLTESENTVSTSDDAAGEIERRVRGRLSRSMTPSLVTVINATGVILHTNLGRAPLSREAAVRVAEVAAAYTNLEYDLEAGERGARDGHAERLLCALTGAEAAVVVNNNAAATLLMLAALAAGREVIVSRGELVEIGGGFRVPDVMAQSGARLREVGTTNRTRASDYAAAIDDRTALILRVHPSNFQIDGYTARPTLEELVSIGQRYGVPVVEDLGSGYFGPPAGAPDVPDEPSVPASISGGADVVSFSGDKLLGGPQAGILAGRREPLAAIRRHPLMRALRVDKLTYAALEATLIDYATGRAVNIPVSRMLGLPVEAIAARAAALADRLRTTGFRVELIDGFSTIGGGSAPGSKLPTCLVAIERPGSSAASLLAALRRLSTPIIARIHNDRVVLDLRTVFDEQDAVLTELVATIEPRKLS